MPLTFLNLPYHEIDELEVEAFVCVIGNGEQKAVFGRRAEVRFQKACEKYEFLQKLDAGELELDLTKFGHREYYLSKTSALYARHIFHTTAPTYINGKHGEAAQLRKCYLDTLDLAKSIGCESILFPLISSKVYGYPYREAYTVAINAINDWLTANDMDITLLIFDRKTVAVPKPLRRDVDGFIKSHYEFKANPKYKGLLGWSNAYNDRMTAEKAGKYELDYPGRYRRLIERYEPEGAVYFSDPEAKAWHEERLRKLREELGETLDDSFSVALIDLINAKGKTAVDVYKRANIDRRLFSKIRNDFYVPGKRTAIALALALELSLDETRNLLGHAGFTLSHSLLFDVIIEYSISQGKYDIFEINNVLFDYDQPLLGG